MKLTQIIEPIMFSSATAACALMLNSAASFADTSRTDSQPIQTTAVCGTIFIAEPPNVIAAEPQLMLFDRHLKVPVIEAPLWLTQRMKALQQRPPPTLQAVRAQWAASMEFSRKLENRQTASSNGHGNGASS